MKKILSLIIFLCLYTGVSAQVSHYFEENGLGQLFVPDYKNTCEAEQERTFTLRVVVDGSDDKVELKRVYWAGHSGCVSGGATIVSPTTATNGIYRAANSTYLAHYEFTIKTKDSYISGYNCTLLADWKLEDKQADGTTDVTNITGQQIDDYAFNSSIAAPTSVSRPDYMKCGLEEVITISIAYESNIDAYNVVGSSTTTILTNTIQRSGTTCKPRYTFDIRVEACGDAEFVVERTNAIGSVQEPYTIQSSGGHLPPVDANGVKTFSGEQHFCLIDGNKSVYLIGAYNNLLFGTDYPTGVQVDDLLTACPNEISATWSIISSTTPGGIVYNPISTTADFAYGWFDIVQEGEYIIEYTINVCDVERKRSIKITGCDEVPVLATVPPIDIQYLCSTFEEPLCANVVNNGCYNTLTTNTTDYKLLASSQGSNLCLSSIFPRQRVSQLEVKIENACGSDQAIWDIYIDHPEHCETTTWRLNVDQGNGTIAARLESNSKQQAITPEGKEIIQQVIIYDMSGRMIWSKSGVEDTYRVLLPSQKLEQARTYVVQVITNQQTYSKPFIKS